MFIRANMIIGNIQENSIIKEKSVYPVHQVALGRNLHHDVTAARFHHFCKIFLQNVGFRRRIFGRIMILTDHSAVRSDETRLLSGCLQNRLDHISGSRLSLRAGHTDRRHLPRRIIKTCRRKKR